MRVQFMWTVALLLQIVRGKFVKIENLHLKEDNEDGKNQNHWNNDLSSSSSSQLVTSTLGNRTSALRGFRGEGGAAKLLQSVNEVNLDGNSSLKKEWKSFYHYPHHHYNGGAGGTATGSVLPTTTSSVPFGWSNGVINNNNLLSVGGYNPVATTTSVGAPYSGFGGLGAGVGAPSTVQCLLFGVMGLVTFLLNSVMALLLSVKLPALDGLLGPLLGGLGLGALNKQEAVTVADMKSKQKLEFMHFPNSEENENSPGYFDKNQ